MHILHFIESLEFGGAEKVVVNLCNQAIAEGHRVSLCLSKRKGELVDQLDEKVHIHFLDSGEGNNPQLPALVTEICRRENVDVLHGHEWSVLVESALVARKIPKLVHIHTIHGHYIQYQAGMITALKKRIRRMVERWLGKKIDCIVGVSDAISASIRADLGFEHNVKTIHNGIADLADGQRQKLAADDNAESIKLLWVGRVARVKNLPMLIDALAQLSSDFPAIRLDLVGNGPELDQIRRLARQRSVEDLVTFHGFCSEVEKFYREADIFVMTSDYEGISIAALEAMRAALPIVATDVGGMAEMVCHGETGLLVKKGAAGEMAGALDRLLNNPAEVKRLGNRSRALFCQEFEQKVMFDRYLACYQGRS